MRRLIEATLKDKFGLNYVPLSVTKMEEWGRISSRNKHELPTLARVDKADNVLILASFVVRNASEEIILF